MLHSQYNYFQCYTSPNDLLHSKYNMFLHVTRNILELLDLFKSISTVNTTLNPTDHAKFV